MKKIYISGSINTDFIIKSERVPVAGETITGSGFTTAHGGKGANQATACARLGGDTLFCACTGDDVFGSEAVSSFINDKIEVSHIKKCPDTPTGTAVIILSGGDNRIIIDRSANASVNKADIDGFLDSAAEGDIFLTQLETPLQTVAHSLKSAHEKGMYVIFNPAPADKLAGNAFEYCDMVIVNETEAELFGGRSEILKKTEGILIVTLGSHGYEICNNKGSKVFPCYKVSAVDTTGAGDTFCGGIAASLSRGQSIEQAASFASAAASLACTKLGAQPSIPTKAETEAFIASRRTE